MSSLNENIVFRILSINECDRISEIDPSQLIEKAWRNVDGHYELLAINYMENDWPDGYETYRDELKNTITSGGVAFGAFNQKNCLVGFVTINHDFFGETARYLLFESMFVSRLYRGYGIGKKLFKHCAAKAYEWGADKLYLCAASSEDTIAFYKSVGCVNAEEINKALFDKDHRDIQLEYDLKRSINMKNIFEIECKDIVLRELGIDDLDALYNLTLQPEITDFLPDWKATKEQRRDWLINFHMKNNREFFQAVPSIDKEGLILGIILKETNEFIGWCGSCIKDELPPPNREIFYAISKDYRGKGYTSQASQGLIKYLFERTNIEELNAIALLHNIPSNKVIQKCGFNQIGTIEVDNEEFNYYKLMKKIL
ncbi:GNAT family N-acetyltransferase [Clostridium tagluense]|uniref:GNAT family N-acetyltransferase n=1 Tax=Clostridium tagluense TaxID=360422 RepID=UPI001CF51821|nr:GNAT family N-acetyltransferase [Clostridium tagluense]MCB2296171.1 GNAT family N-acetyltransferase [Clostridium tagluense]